VSSIGRIMAERTTQSWTQVPQFYVTRAVDATNMNASRARRVPEIERSHGVKVTHTDILVAGRRPIAAPLPADERQLEQRLDCDARRGERRPRDGGGERRRDRGDQERRQASLGDIAKERKELTERARANRLTPADIQGATFTISNLGMMEVDAFTAIIVPPQAGILAVGAIKDQVVASGGFIGIKPMMNLTLTSDHRVIDGARAAEFLNDVVAGLTDPDKWL
jgi:pyruvate dehydrogenase E2 component (dihydrolipoamide acetyltransferase)